MKSEKSEVKSENIRTDFYRTLGIRSRSIGTLFIILF
jgi:hypothetical protein